MINYSRKFLFLFFLLLSLITIIGCKDKKSEDNVTEPTSSETEGNGGETEGGEGETDEVGDLLDIAADIDVVKKSGAWYSYNDTKLGQGRENVKNFLQDNPDLIKEIDQKVRHYYKLDESKETSQEEDTLLDLE